MSDGGEVHANETDAHAPESVIAGPPRPPSTPRHALQLADGTVIDAAAGARYRIEPSSRHGRDPGEREPAARRVDVYLDQGELRFERPLAGDGVVVVELGSLRVEAFHAAFSAYRAGAVDDDHVMLIVEEGELVITTGGGRRALTAGETIRVDLVGDGAPGALVHPARSPRRAGGQASASRAVEVPAWQALADAGRHAEAFAALSHHHFQDDADPVSTVLRAVDVARHAGHPQRAAAWLQEALSAHPHDPRAPLVAFTLGRVRNELPEGAPGAAEAFARARALAPDGPLAEDALAREIKARARAGDSAEAAALAEAYLDLYPQGRWASAARRLGEAR